MVTMTCSGPAHSLNLCEGGDVLCHILECSWGYNLHGLITSLHNRTLDLSLSISCKIFVSHNLSLHPIYALVELCPKTGLYPARMEIPKHVHPVPLEVLKLVPRWEKKMPKQQEAPCPLDWTVPPTVRTLSWCTIWRMHRVTQQATSSPGRARRKDFPSSIFPEKDFAAAKQSTVRDTKHPD